MVLAEFAIFPTDKGTSVSQYVAQVIDCIDTSGITYQLTPMGTIIEGTWEQVMATITACYTVLESNCDRIYCTATFDYRKTDSSRMKSKTDKIQSILNRPINV